MKILISHEIQSWLIWLKRWVSINFPAIYLSFNFREFQTLMVYHTSVLKWRKGFLCIVIMTVTGPLIVSCSLKGKKSVFCTVWNCAVISSPKPIKLPASHTAYRFVLISTVGSFFLNFLCVCVCSVIQAWEINLLVERVKKEFVPTNGLLRTCRLPKLAWYPTSCSIRTVFRREWPLLWWSNWWRESQPPSTVWCTMPPLLSLQRTIPPSTILGGCWKWAGTTIMARKPCTRGSTVEKWPPAYFSVSFTIRGWGIWCLISGRLVIQITKLDQKN